MLEHLSIMGITGTAVVVIVSIVVAAELIKAVQALWAFVADKYLGFKTQYTERKEREQLVYKNEEELHKFIQKQEKFDTDIQKELNNLGDTLKDVSDSVVQLRVSEMRAKILDFASAISNGRPYSREQFNYIKKLYTQYEVEIKKRKMRNDEVSISMEIINNIFADRVRNKAFIEDRINDPVFQEKVRQIIESQGKKDE